MGHPINKKERNNYKRNKIDKSKKIARSSKRLKLGKYPVYAFKTKNHDLDCDWWISSDGYEFRNMTGKYSKAPCFFAYDGRHLKKTKKSIKTNAKRRIRHMLNEDFHCYNYSTYKKCAEVEWKI